MKKAVLLLSLLLLATMAAAQTASQSSFAPPSGAQTSAAPSHPRSATVNDLRGCISGKNGDYTLTDHQGKQHRVVGDDHLLWDDVGHEVDITGTPANPPNTLKESEITDIASRCWNFRLN
jgi:hypothetical protein